MTAPAFSHPRVIEVVRFLDETRADVVRAIAAFPRDRWQDVPAAGGWSAAQIIDHLRVVEHGIVRLLQKLIPEAITAGHPAETATSSVLNETFIARTMDRSRRIEAPPRVLPTSAPDIEAGLAAMATERTALLSALQPGDGLALGTLHWAHPALGTLDLYQWLVFVGAHEARHTAQLREIAVSARSIQP